MLTIAYMTSRRNPRLHFFLDSLHRECGGNYQDITVLVVDHYYEEATSFPRDPSIVRPLNLIHERFSGAGRFLWCSPMPNVWNGKYRWLKKNWFAVATARNTALCVAPGDWISFVDDLSVLTPGWLRCVRQAMDGNYLVFGAYKKVFDLNVVDGKVASYKPHQAGTDSRWNSGRDDGPVLAAGSWMYGCSLAGPIEAFLRVNGYETVCDSMGFEDCITGMLVERTSGYQLRYDRRMLTLEDEGAHYEDEPFIRRDKGVSPNDRSHAVLNEVLHRGQKMSINAHYGPDGIRGLRARIQAGEKFPAPAGPLVDWYDGMPVKDFDNL